MQLRHLSLTDFRSYRTADLEPAPGLTVLLGGNGDGKTNLLEAIGYLATLSSFRSVPGEALVRAGCPQAVVRAEVEGDASSGTGPDTGARVRTSLIEAELRVSGRDRVLVNRQPLRRVRNLLGLVRVTVFTPDDLALVKGGPGDRRRLLDEVVVACWPRLDATRGDLERVVRQRSALLKQVANARGSASPEVAATLDVWDARFAELGERLGRARRRLVGDLRPAVAVTYDQVSVVPAGVGVVYDPPWLARPGGLAAALAAARGDDLRRGLCTVGPHRDELELTIGGHPARTHASQGEQRTLALALRLASHAVVTSATGSTPIVLLDDVLSELDDVRSAALMAHLPPGQVVVTTTTRPPGHIRPDLVLRVGDGVIARAA